MHTIEFKAELRDPLIARRQCQLLGAVRMGVLQQTDTYFKIHDGRLKMREAPGEPTEWIYYHRRDIVRPRMNSYTILSDAQARHRWGTQSLKPWIVVKKFRELWMLDNVRIHLDEVEELGTFIEFEALISKRFDVQSCHARINELRQTFSPTLGEAVGPSYSDLVAQKPVDLG